MKTNTKQSGFTLVELAIVLVIIGLIVGGVLVGQDLIKAATLQKGVKLLSDTEAGATTFRAKYNALPGDYSGAAAAFTAPVAITGITPATVGLGDGDGNIVAVTAVAGGTATKTLGASGEVALFYPELFDAGYIKETMTYGALTALPSLTQLQSGTFLSFPLTGTNKPVVVAATFNGKNYLSIVGVPTAAAAVPSWTGALLPLDAASIDGKLDDGAPTTGNVLAVGSTAAVATFPVTPGTAALTGTATTGCFTGTAYNAALLTQNCNISYRASF